MASTAVERETQDDNTSPWQTDSISTWTDGGLALVAVLAADDSATAPGDTSRGLTGNGQTWTSEANVIFTDSATFTARLELWSAHLSSPTSGVIEATFTGTQPESSVLFKCAEISEVPSSAAVVQSATNSGNGTAITTTLAAFADATNNVAFLAAAQVGPSSPALSFGTLTELGADQTGASAFQFSALAHGWQVGEDLSPDATSDQSQDWGAIAVEIDNDGGAVASLPPVRSVRMAHLLGR